MKVCFNGKICEEKDILVSPFADSFQSEIGVFETFRVLSGRPVFFEAHLERLENSRNFLGFGWPDLQNLSSLEAAVKNFFQEEAQIGDWRCKIVLTPEFWACRLVPLKALPPEVYKFGVVVDSTVETRIFPEAKYLSPLYIQYPKKDVFETLFFDEKDFLKEGNITNVFIVTPEAVITPKSGILLGIMRAKVLENLSSKNQKVAQRPIHKSEVLKSQAIFLTNVIKGVIPVRRFGDWEGKDFDLAHRLQTEIFDIEK